MIYQILSEIGLKNKKKIKRIIKKMKIANLKHIIIYQNYIIVQLETYEYSKIDLESEEEEENVDYLKPTELLRGIIKLCWCFFINNKKIISFKFISF